MESRWPSLLLAVQRVQKQFTVLVAFFEKSPNSDLNTVKNDRCRFNMYVLRSTDTMVKLDFLKSVKSTYDQFLNIFLTEGPLIHVLYLPMFDHLKLIMSRCIKPNSTKSVPVLLKSYPKKTEHQLKGNEQKIGVPEKEALKNLKNTDVILG